MGQSSQGPALATEQTRGLDWSTWIEINLDALAFNWQEIKKHTGVAVLPVLKSNAYGHGAPLIAAFLQKQGCPMVAVSTLEEALLILQTVTIPILLLTPPLKGQLPPIVRHNIIPTVTSLGLLEELGDLASKNRRIIEFHLKVDTGFGRLGVAPDDVVAVLNICKNTPYLKLGGVFTHFSAAFQNKDFTTKQLGILLQLKKQLEEQNKANLLWHCANSAAFLTLSQSHLNLVRIGTLLYGQSPLPLDKSWQLKDTWQLKTRLIQIKTLPKGHYIGYGREYKTKRATKIGVLPVGYGHGLDIQPTGTILDLSKQFLSKLIRKDIPHAIFQGEVLPIIGRIGMGLSCVDLTKFPQLKVGDELVVPLRRVTADSLLPRIYLFKGEQFCVYWNNKFFFNGRWRTSLRGLFPLKSLPHHRTLHGRDNLFC